MWEKLKQILKTENDKAVVVEDGEPKYVILSIEEYMKLVSDNSSGEPKKDNSSPSEEMPPVDVSEIEPPYESSEAETEEAGLDDLPL